MGCQASKLADLEEVTVSVVEPSFMKPENEYVRDRLSENHIKHEYYISIDCFIDEFTRRYINEVVVGLDKYQQVHQRLNKMGFSPNIYAIGKPKEIEENLPDNIFFLSSYDELIEKLQSKGQRGSEIDKKQQQQNQKKEKRIDVKILKKAKNVQTSQQIIFHQTLKAKGLTHQIFQTFQQLEQSMYERDSHFIVTDYVYHREVLSLVSKIKTRVICYCNLLKEEAYDPQVYFVSNNFLQISTQIANEVNFKNLSRVKCSKVYFYTVNVPHAKDYVSTAEAFNFEVRPFSDLDKMLKETTYFFSVTILVGESEIKNVENYLQRNEYGFKVKIVTLQKGVQPSAIGMRKILKEFKKGYRAEKKQTNSIDIIDKHYDNIKFEQIKAELEKNDINCYGYSNLSNYMKNKKFISPFIICNFQQRVLLTRYLKQVDSSAKVIIFCNKTKINPQLKDNKNYAYVSSHFGKILTFIKKKHVFRPVIYGEKQIQITEKVQKLKNKNRRISALKWCGLQEENIVLQGSEKQTEEDFRFVNISKDAPSSAIKDLQKDAAILWRLDYKPFTNFLGFKQDLSSSLQKLRKIYRVKYPQNQFNSLLSEIREMEIGQLMGKVKEFFDSESELGLNINQTLVKLETLNRSEIVSLREFLFLVNLNFASIYRMPKLGTIRLEQWSQQALLGKCEVGSYLLSKNYCIFYEEGHAATDQLGKYKISVEVNCDSLSQQDLMINLFFKYRDKYIFSPYCQFVVKNLTKQLGITHITLALKNNVEFLKYYYAENLLGNATSFLDLYQKAISSADSENMKKISPLIDFRILDLVRLNHQRLQALTLFKEQQYKKAIEMHKKTIKEEQEMENLDSVKVTELHYELSLFLLANGNHQEAASVIKEIMESKPTAYVRQKCERIVSDIVNEGQVNLSESLPQVQDKLKEANEEESGKNDPKSNSRVGKKAANTMKMDPKALRNFFWIQENNGDMDDLNDSNSDEAMYQIQVDESQQRNAEQQIFREIKNNQEEVHCLEIDDYEQKLGKDAKQSQRLSESDFLEQEKENQQLVG